MRTRDFFVSAILMIIGAVVFLYTQDGLEKCSTSLGQIGQLFSNNIGQECRSAGVLNLFSAVWFLAFLVLMIYHATAKPR